MVFTDILQEHRIEFSEAGGGGHARAGWVNFACPFCGGGKHKDSMGYNLAKGFLSCYRCGPHRMNETLMALLNLTFPEVKKLTGDMRTDPTKAVEDPRGKLVIPKGVGALQPAHLRYLKARGFDPAALVKGWGVAGIGIASRLAWRLFIPISLGADVVSWTTRAIAEEAELRYVSASAEEEAVNHKTLLYGEQYCRHACCLVEGPTDAWAIGHGAGATCGTGFSRAQLARFAKFPVRGVCFDNEPAAQRRAREVVDEMSVFPGETYNLVLEHGKDPASTTPQEIQQIRKVLGL